MTTVWAAHHEELCSNGVVPPQVCDLMVVPNRWVVREWGTPLGAAVDAALAAAARAQRTAGAVLMAVLRTCRRLSISCATRCAI